MSAPGLDLDAIRARAAAATPGPWMLGCDFGNGTLGPETVVIAGNKWPLHLDPYRNGFEDAKFIAQARTDIPALLAEVQRLRAENNDLQTQVVLLGDELHQAGEDLAELQQRIGGGAA